MSNFNDDYVKLQTEGSGWSYGSAWGDQMEEAVVEWFAKSVPIESSVVDIGCGEGRGMDALKNCGFKSISGIDLSQEKLDKAKSRGWETVYNEDFHKLIRHQYEYDYAFCSHTLEHAYDLELALSSIELVVKKALFFIVPVGETKEGVATYNPSHTSPIKDIDEIRTLLTNMGYAKFHLEEKTRMCKEVWGIIYYD